MSAEVNKLGHFDAINPQCRHRICPMPPAPPEIFLSRNRESLETSSQWTHRWNKLAVRVRIGRDIVAGRCHVAGRSKVRRLAAGGSRIRPIGTQVIRSTFREQLVSPPIDFLLTEKSPSRHENAARISRN